LAGLAFEPCQHFDDCVFVAQLPDPFRRSQSQFHDRGRRSGCEKKIWRHNNVAHLQQLLIEAGRDRVKRIVFESLYSMDGDIAPVREVVELAGATQRAHLYR
jgi:7-keto-8-aminopelargonate synthetase-like enzyme